MTVLSPVLSPGLRALRRVRRRVLLHRRPLAAVCAAVAVLAAVRAVAPPPPPTVPVWTAVRDLPGGEVLAAGDVVRRDVAPSAVPRGAVTDLRPVLGRRLAAPMNQGEPLTDVRTLAPRILAGYPGTIAVPVRVADADVVDLLRVGDRVSLVAADPDGTTAPQQVAQDVAVVALPVPERQGLSPGDGGRLVVLAVPTPEAVTVAARSASGVLIPVWDR